MPLERIMRPLLAAFFVIVLIWALLSLSKSFRAGRDAVQSEETETPAAPISTGEYTALTWNNGTTTLNFKKEGEQWLWADDTSFPLDDQIVTEIAAHLRDLHPQQTITDGQLSAHGLDRPTATLRAEREGGNPLLLSFGSTTTDGKSRYIMADDDPNRMYIIDDQLYQLLLTPIYDMAVLPVLPDLAESRLQSISISGLKLSHFTAQHTEGTDSVRWRLNGQELADDTLLQGLLRSLRRMEFARCIDYAPSEEAVALMGLQNPSAVVRIEYSDDEGGTQECKLTIGDRLESGEGRYACLGDEEAVYLIETEWLEELMHIAVYGTEDAPAEAEETGEEST